MKNVWMLSHGRIQSPWPRSRDLCFRRPVFLVAGVSATVISSPSVVPRVTSLIRIVMSGPSDLPVHHECRGRVEELPKSRTDLSRQIGLNQSICHEFHPAIATFNADWKR